MTELRFCKKCNREKFLLDFDFHTRSSGGRRHECRDCHRARMNIHYLKNKPHRLLRAKERYQEKPSAVWTEEKRLRANENSKRYRQEHFQTVLDHYGPRCACCGEENLLFLTVDHINNDGAEHRRKGTGKVSLAFYRWIIKNDFPDDLRILCFNCNCGRQRNGGICPHVTEGSTIIPQGSRAKRPEALSSRRRLMI